MRALRMLDEEGGLETGVCAWGVWGEACWRREERMDEPLWSMVSFIPVA